MTDQLHDPLTGAYSRAMFNTRLPKEVQRAVRSGDELALLMLDLDYFKSINDAFGHKRGDEALRGVVERIRSQLRESDEVFRYGGDEFVVLLPRATRDQAVEVAQRILRAVSDPPLPGEPPLSLSVSIGLACAPQEAKTVEALFELADQRHYAAKQNGRGQVVSEDVLQTVQKEPWMVDRLLGRDQALNTLRAFFDSLETRAPAAMSIFGARGSGRTRLLKEAHRMSRLRGYAVLFLQGSPGLRYRLFGAVNETLSGWLQHTHFISVQKLTRFFTDLMERKSLRGLIILLDDWPLLDDGTLGLVRHLLQNFSHQVGLIFSAENQEGVPDPKFEPTQTFSTRLEALQQSEVRAWMRHSLGAEPSAEILTWFFQRTSGEPGKIASALRFLSLPEHQSLPWEQARARLESFFDSSLPLSNLPLNLTLFVGREQEIETIKQALRQSRPVSIVGLGGIGKTRLALQVALESQDVFPDGVFFVPIAPLILPEILYRAIGQALGLRVPAGDAGRKTLLEVLHNKRLLLVLDNFEALPDAAPLLLPLLKELPGLRILLTSRAEIGLEEERVFTLQGLEVPPVDAEDPSVFASCELFVQQAERALPAYQPQWEAVAEICRLVDGLPLALELAASWVSTFSETEIAAQIRSSAGFLAGQTTSDQDPHRSMQAVFESLWLMFSPSEQQNLAGLGVFRGRFTRSAAWDVLGISSFFIDALTVKTILRRADENYYRIQPMLWDFFRQKLNLEPEYALSCQERHALYFFNLLEERAPLFDDPSLGGQALRLTDGQSQNLRAAWEFAFRQARADLMAQALEPYCAFLRAQGWYVEGVRLLQRILPTLASARSAAYSQAVILLGEFFFHAGYYLESAALLERLIAAQPDSRILAQALHRLALTYNALGRLVDSLRLQRRGMNLARELGDVTLQYEFTNRASISAYMNADYHRAVDLGQQALALARSLNSTPRMAQVFNNMANFYYELGDFEQAQEFIQHCLPILEGVTAQALKVSIYDSAGKIYTAVCDFDRARQMFLLAFEMLRLMKAWPLLAEVLVGVAELWQAQGKAQPAQDLAWAVCISGYAPHSILLRAKKLCGTGVLARGDSLPDAMQTLLLETQAQLKQQDAISGETLSAE